MMCRAYSKMISENIMIKFFKFDFSNNNIQSILSYSNIYEYSKIESRKKLMQTSNPILCLQLEENAKELSIIKQFYIKIECLLYILYTSL